MLSPGQAVLFLAVDVLSNLPVGYAKFNYNGVFTVRPQSTQLSIPYTSISLQPVQIMESTSVIPLVVDYVQNAMMVKARMNSVSKASLQDMINQAVA